MAVNKDEEAPFLDDIDEIEEELEIEDEADDGELSFDDPKAGVDPTDDMDAVIEERDALKDRLLRAFADLENTRKRAERDRRDAESYGGTKLARFTDYPHGDSQYPHAVKAFRKLPLSEETQRKIVGDNWSRLYDIPLTRKR